MGLDLRRRRSRSGPPGTGGERTRDGPPALRRRWIVLAAVGAVAAVGLGALLGGWFGSSGPLAPAKPGHATPEGFVRFGGPGVGFSIAHPAGWRRLRPVDPDVKLLAASRDAGPSASLLVRVIELPFSVGPRELDRVRGLTREIVTGGRRARIIQGPKTLRLGGLPAQYYLYTFRDRDRGERGVHAHYFAFDGTAMITLVFQSLPESRFERDAPTFDRIAGTFRDETP